MNTQEIYKGIKVDIPEINEKLDDITSIPRGMNMAQAINSLIASGKKNIKIPAGTWTITEPIILESYVEIYSDKNTTLTTSLDIPIITTKKIDGIGISEVYIHDLGLTNTHSNPTNYQLDLCNVNMSKVSRVRCVTNSSYKNSVGGLKVYKKGGFVAPSGIFSILIDKCDFRNSSMEILITDSYITNCNIWAYNRSFALHIGASSQQISDCQFVGSDVKGAVWIEDNSSLGYDVEIIKISNCYFDGSYSDIQSGIGLNAKKMRYSNISNCSFWHQKEDGIVLDGCFGNTITNNNFKCNGVNNQRENNTLNKAQGFSDIKIINDFYSNVISDNTFSTDGIDYFIKNKAIDGTGINTSYNNIITNNTIHDHWRYPSDSFDISKIQGTKFNNLNGFTNPNNSHVLGGVTFDGNITTTKKFIGKGFKGERIFNFDGLNSSSGQGVSARGNLPIYAFTKETLVDSIALNISTPITTGSIVVRICKNSVAINEASITISQGQYTTVVDFITPVIFGRGDTLTVKAWASSDLDSAKNVSATVGFTQ